MSTLYERLGGLEAIAAVVESFVGRCAGDSRINAKFVRTDVPRLQKMLVDQVCEATGGPCTYTGRSMTETHDGMGVTAGEFEALVEDLVATLDEFGVPAVEQDELLGLLERFATGNGDSLNSLRGEHGLRQFQRMDHGSRLVAPGIWIPAAAAVQ